MALIFESGQPDDRADWHHHATDWPLTPEALRAATKLVSQPPSDCTDKPTAPKPLAAASA
jgi:hypothetical protein